MQGRLCIIWYTKAVSLELKVEISTEVDKGFQSKTADIAKSYDIPKSNLSGFFSNKEKIHLFNGETRVTCIQCGLLCKLRL